MTDTSARYPQPREGIAGSDRTKDDLLGLDDKAIARRLLMIGTAAALKSAVMVGDPAPVVATMWARMKAPRPGDLVMESTSMYGRDTDTRIKGFGILIASRREWMSTDEEWQAELAQEPSLRPGDRIADDAWYVQYGPSAEDVCRWTNCEFIAVPTSHDWAAAPDGQLRGH